MGISFAAQKHPVLTTLRDLPIAKKAAGDASWRNGVKHSWQYGKRGRDDIIYVRTVPCGVNLTSKNLTRERNNSH
jgi:hypothetical protein